MRVCVCECARTYSEVNQLKERNKWMNEQMNEQRHNKPNRKTKRIKHGSEGIVVEMQQTSK